MNLKPLGSHVIVKPINNETITQSGIVLPDTINQERPEKGKVVAVGSGKILANGQRSEMSVKVGDQVMFKKYSPDEISLGDEDYLVIKEEDIMLIIE